MSILRKYQGAFLRIVGYEEPILSCGKGLYFDLYIISKFNGGVLIGACPPGRGFAAAKTQVGKPYGDQLPPYLSFAAFYAGTVIVNGYIRKADLFRNGGFFIAAFRRDREKLRKGHSGDKGKTDNKVKRSFHTGDI